MDQKLLKTFMIAAETLNFTKTAAILNFAQSSVTAQIKALERELEMPLFERLGKRLILTGAGREFKGYAEKMMMLSEEAKLAVGGGSGLSGTIVIGAQESQCTYRLPPILKDFKQQHPNIRLTFKPANSDELARKHLMEGVLDLAFIMDVPKPEDALNIESLIKEEVLLVCAPDHPLAEKSKVYLSDIGKETLLLTENGCSYRTLLENAFRTENVYPNHTIEFASIEAIKQCVMAGLGIAALPAMAVNRDLKMGRFVNLNWENGGPAIFTHLAWHKDKWMTEPIKDFIELTRRTFENYRING